MRNPWTWLTQTVKPWLWIPFLETNRDVTLWALGIVPFIDWAPGYHFDRLGVTFLFGPYTAAVGLKDNN
jgi:hypothetical protein